MSAHRSSYLRPSKRDSLETEHDYLYLLRNRHLEWMNNTEDPELRRMHGEIIHSIKHLIDRFEILLEAMQRDEG